MECTRCKGTGLRDCARVHLGVPGLCFGCDGDGTRATQIEKKRQEKQTKSQWDAYTAALDVTTAVRTANGGPKLPPRERRRMISPSMVFTTQQYADMHGLSKKEAWVELCCWTRAYPHIGADLVADGWEMAA